MAGVGYDLHIERAKRLTRAEWKKIVDGDPDFAGALSFRDGRIAIKNPTDDEIAQLTQLARTLKGRVVGDDGEEYALRPVKKQRARRRPAQNASKLIAKAKQKADSLPRCAGRPRTVFLLTLYKRNAMHYVGASIPSDAGMQALADVMIPTTTAIDDIAAALTRATEIAHAAMNRPEQQRFADGTPPWELAGAPTWNQFCVGVSAADIVFGPRRTRITHMFRSPDHPGSLTDGGEVVELARNASDVEVAEAALTLLVEREKKPDYRPVLAARRIEIRATKGSLRAQLDKLMVATGKSKLRELKGDKHGYSFVHGGWDTRMWLASDGEVMSLSFMTERGPCDQRIERAFAAALPALGWQVLRIVEGTRRVWKTVPLAIVR
jgi:hypothetical protein